VETSGQGAAASIQEPMEEESKAMTQKPATSRPEIFLLIRSKGTDEVAPLAITTQTGDKVLVCFTTRAKAEEAVRRKNLGPEWEIAQPSRDGFLNILREALRTGLKSVVFDVFEENARGGSIFQLLVELEA
jgi:hypothetical protein